MPTRSITLTDHLDEFVESQVATGRFADASELICEALRRLDEQGQNEHPKRFTLHQAAKRGFDEIDQGQAIVLKDMASIHQFIAAIELNVQSSRDPNDPCHS